MSLAFKTQRTMARENKNKENAIAIQEQEKLNDDFAKLKSEINDQELTPEQLLVLRSWLVNIATIGVYDDHNTPLDAFDQDCHNKYGTLNRMKTDQRDLYMNFGDSNYKFLINVAEHAGRPVDMLQLLGDYFKETIITCEQVSSNIRNHKEDGAQEQQYWYITPELVNSLGTACKEYIEPSRQQLRIAIALIRSPTFENSTQQSQLRKEIKTAQIEIIERCTKIYKFVDYIHDRKSWEVPLANIDQQQNPANLKALLYKIKADFQRYIYECLSGDDGLLFNDRKQQSFVEDIKAKNAREITGEGDEVMENYKEHESETLLEYMKKEVYDEYENVKTMIFTLDFKPVKQTVEEGIQLNEFAPFHPVFLTALLNQQVFKRDNMNQEIKERLVAYDLKMKKFKEENDGLMLNKQNSVLVEEDYEDDQTIIKEQQEKNLAIVNYIQKWLNIIEVTNSFSTLVSAKDEQMCWNLFELLEKSIEKWEWEYETI